MLLCKVVYFLVVSKLLCNINFMDVATLGSYSVYIDLSVCVCVCVYVIGEDNGCVTIN